MVSGIMGALDIAPTLHFVEPGLKINGEECIKEMDEISAPTAPMELGHKFLLLLSTRRRTLARLLFNTTRQCCTAQSSLNHRVARTRKDPQPHKEMKNTQKRTEPSCVAGGGVRWCVEPSPLPDPSR